MGTTGCRSRNIVITDLGKRTLILMRLGVDLGDDPPWPDEPQKKGRPPRGPRDPAVVKRAAEGRRRAQARAATAS